MSTLLAHPYRFDRASTKHFLSNLAPIKLEIHGNRFIVRTSLRKDCPEVINDYYKQLGASDEALIFWLMDGTVHDRSLAKVKEKLLGSIDSEEVE
jgi:hypothetical protein